MRKRRALKSLPIAILVAGSAAIASADDLSVRLDRGAELLSQTRLEDAAPIFAEAFAEAEATGSQHWALAAYGYATILHQQTPIRRENVQRAFELFERIHEEKPESALGKQSLLMQARIFELPDYPGDEVQLEEARHIYKQLAENYRFEPIAIEAAIRYASTYLQQTATDTEAPVAPLGNNLDLPRKGTDYLEAYLKDAPASPLLNAAWEYLGKAYWRGQRDDRKALESWLHATGDFGMLAGEEPVPEKQNVDRINPGYLYWAIATLAQGLDERAVAIEYYGRIITEVPRYKATMAQIRLAEMGVPENDIPQVKTFATRR